MYHKCTRDSPEQQSMQDLSHKHWTKKYCSEEYVASKRQPGTILKPGQRIKKRSLLPRSAARKNYMRNRRKHSSRHERYVCNTERCGDFILGYLRCEQRLHVLHLEYQKTKTLCKHFENDKYFKKSKIGVYKKIINQLQCLDNIYFYGLCKENLKWQSVQINCLIVFGEVCVLTHILESCKTSHLNHLSATSRFFFQYCIQIKRKRCAFASAKVRRVLKLI